MINTEEFQTKKYTTVKNFIDNDTVNTVSIYLENLLNRHPENKVPKELDTISSIAWYADPLTELLLENLLPKVENITGYKLYPTYSYARVYTKGEALLPHIDRPACEISVTCHIATVGKPWSVWMQAPGENPTEHFLGTGDACVYHGCEVKHWRVVATETDINVQVMLHYVRQDGPNAHYKFDCRKKLSLPYIGDHHANRII